MDSLQNLEKVAA